MDIFFICICVLSCITHWNNAQLSFSVDIFRILNFRVEDKGLILHSSLKTTAPHLFSFHVLKVLAHTTLLRCRFKGCVTLKTILFKILITFCPLLLSKNIKIYMAEILNINYKC